MSWTASYMPTATGSRSLLKMEKLQYVFFISYFSIWIIQQDNLLIELSIALIENSYMTQMSWAKLEIAVIIISKTSEKFQVHIDGL